MSSCATRQWQSTRSSIDWNGVGSEPVSVKVGSSDGIKEYINITAETRGADRAQRLLLALYLERKLLSASNCLCLQAITEWQEIAEPKGATLRTTPAFAKKNEEEYGHWNGIWETLDSYLLEAVNDDLPLASRAVRAYLDICFFHPFVDGNGRAALLVMDFILRRENMSLKTAGMIFKLPYYADDIVSISNFVRQVNMLLATQPVK